ncbi:transcriptional regulator AryK [Macrococcus animalis]|uniref:transcriptional regulator AryK n=1 Tax=Macrococcus animalis TaxID=3395467 RepID=UPI0039BE1AE2
MNHYDIKFNNEPLHNLTKTNGLKFIFVLKGEMSITLNNESYHLADGDIRLLNHRDMLLINQCVGDYMTLNIPYKMINRIIEDEGTRFDLNRLAPTDNTVLLIRDTLAKIAIVYLRKSKYYKLFIEQQLMSLLSLLYKNVPHFSDTSELVGDSDYRLERVFRYIDAHYDESLTLHQMAEYIGLSQAYLSKLFSKKMGVGFNHYLNEVRLEHVVMDLLYSEDSLTDITMKNGFSNSAVLSRNFKKWANISPSEYRKKHKVNMSVKSLVVENSDKERISMLAPYVIDASQKLIEAPENTKNIDIRLDALDSSLKQFNHVIQIGHLDHLLLNEVQHQLQLTQRDIGITHLLIEDPINSPSLISEEVKTDERIANYQRYHKVDACFDFLVEHHLGIAIRLQPKGEFSVYLSRLKDFFKHIAMRLDMGNRIHVKLFIKDMSLKMYQQLLQMITHYIPTIKVIVFVNLEDIGDFIDIIQSDVHRIEKIAFDANQNDIVNLNVTDDQTFELAKHHIVDKSNEVFKFLQRHEIMYPLMLINWNTLTGDTDLTNGEYFRGGIIFDQFLRLNHIVDTIGYWLNYDLHKEHAISRNEYMNSIELFHQYNGKRPAYFTSALFKKLHHPILFKEHQCLALGRDDHFQIVVYDAEHFNPYLSLNDDLPFLQKKAVWIKINDLKQGLYRIKHYTLDKENGALYQVWQSFNTQYGIDAESIEYINRVSYPKLNVQEVKVDKDLQYDITLQTNAIHILDIKKYED